MPHPSHSPPRPAPAPPSPPVTLRPRLLRLRTSHLVFGFASALQAYETEALLDHLFYHANTAPFIAHRLLQRFGASNPSPRYIEARRGARHAGHV